MTVKSGRTWITVALLVGGCAGANPFVVARFVGQGLTNSGAGGGTTTQPATKIQSTCDLTGDRKVFGAFLLRNASKQVLKYSMTFLVSGGPGGFVCDSDLNMYQQAGYRAIPLDAQTHTTTIGCDPVPLQHGTQLLGLTLTGQIAADNTGGMNPIPAAQPLNGAVRIPIPEIIVLGDNSSALLCQGNNPCTQGGFVYTDIAGNVITKVTASRTQGTVCNARVSNVPEWRLLDPNFDDLTAGAFQYPTGAFIIVDVLDRANNSDPNANQAIWAVSSVNGTLIHPPQP